ncbi:BlaI/MecI/CopY family transcriptional regulator [Aneurinibacillus aneurinilyticus]|uniref:Transcriptional regulator, BlaI/MecI/CopY family n=1 Tax=Aneurinibacillus aneurinilyticus ATCC 12856 TaxID=649747 RepID=U1X7G1_ANEAE|nr:BlaI/MecI/CopY family transcriptional regulator [Aneurinibacillus aneurinilyticus]ERI10920.1 transcriptional regulator, BlaI/MecI/CopY family [Aneurinibacillus aneurinilyticus ATCC 12856]MED0707707.1 BlaI/MecI/CopY family transcriptional regulator [Aneurinibacillus aneurinilyticus]MED0721936.1 BlaI/MecI/CopY family transcriptional regulator [Aneurinibacillus aneurinilyticus]MED0742959.1 BlaI/MecI/CopY family transcriptional regulator [Aneurinibacillus aneurinilyticus]
MKNVQKLSDTEMELMEVIWECDPPVTSTELLRIFTQRGKVWKAQTISTFLSRLVDKGVLEATRHGRTNKYVSRISPKDYKLAEAQHVLDGLYQGSVKNLIAALYDGDKLSDEDITELKQWFSGK